MRRDRLTFAMMVGVPIMQLVLFGYRDQLRPEARCRRRCSTADHEHLLARSFVRAIENTGYFRVVRDVASGGRRRARCSRPARCSSWSRSRRTSRASCSAASGRCCWSRRDATDPAATQQRARRAAQPEPDRARPRPRRAARRAASAGPPPFELRVHAPLQPRGHHAVQHRAGADGRGADDDDGHDDRARDDARARARHDGEPARDAGAPARSDGRARSCRTSSSATSRWRLILGRGEVPVRRADGRQPRAALGGAACSSSPPTSPSASPSRRSRANQLQAMQMAFFFFLPSILLSGFMFPFRGMPEWAQWLGEILPLTHFLRIVRGILLKGNGAADIAAGAVADRRVPARGGNGGAPPLSHDARLTCRGYEKSAGSVPANVPEVTRSALDRGPVRMRPSCLRDRVGGGYAPASMLCGNVRECLAPGPSEGFARPDNPMF